MALKFAKSYVTAPSSLDVSGSGSGIYIFAHRRVNSAGGKTSAIFNYSSVALPATVTPESYADLDELAQDEILISDDFGASWRIVPRTGTLTGVLTVASYDDSWQLSTDYSGDNQLTIPFTLDFGNFSSAGTDDLSFYMISESGTPAVDNLTFSVLDLISNQVGRQYNGILEISITGILDLVSGSVDGSFNDSFIWQFPDLSINRLEVELTENKAVKLVLRLVNLPVGGLENNTLAFSLEIIPNQKLYPISIGDPWYPGAIEIDLSQGYLPNLLTSNGDGTFVLGKLKVNLGNTLAINASPITITANASASYPKFLRVSPNGTFTITNEDQDGSFTLARIASVSGAITVQAPARSVNFASAVGGSPIARRFVRVNTSGNLTTATDAAGILGVSLRDFETAYTYAGLAFIEAGAAVTAGSLVGSDSTGRAVSSATWKNAIALTSATAAGQVILVNVQLTLSTSTGGSGGTGTVTSVGMTVPNYMSVTPASIDVSGTFNLTFNSQTANTVFAAPNGSAGVPGFRALASTDIPALDSGKITSGVIAVDRIPDLSAAKITSGILNSAQIPDLDAAKLASGILNALRMPVGTVIKTATLRSTTNFLTNLDTYQDTGISFSFTPLLSNSLLRIRISTSLSTQVNTIFADLALFKDGSNMNTIATSLAHFRGTSLGSSYSQSVSFEETVVHGSTTATTFNLRLKRAAGVGTNTVAIGRRIDAGGLLDTYTTITVEEIRQ